MSELIKKQNSIFRKKMGNKLNEQPTQPPQKKPEGGEDTVEVQPDFELIAFDFVSNPSTHGAFMSPGKMNESINESVGTRNGTCCHDCAVEDIINDIFRGE